MLRSLQPQLREGDHLTLVFDGVAAVSDLPNAEEVTHVLACFACTTHVFCEPQRLGAYGHGIRTKYTPLLEPTTYVMHADDDDVYTHDAFAFLRAHCRVVALYVAEFRCCKTGGSFPKHDTIAVGNIGTPCGIVPHGISAEGGTWGRYVGGDGGYYEHIAARTRALRVPITFLHHVIYLTNP